MTDARDFPSPAAARTAHKRTIVHRTIACIAAIAWACGLQALDAQTTPAERAFARAVDRELSAPLFRRTVTGIEISDLGTGRVLYRRNADLLLRPASNTKLFTTAAALIALGDTFPFATRLFAHIAPDGTADLWLRGAGDPLFDRADLDSLAAGIVSTGIRSVRTLTLDTGSFDSTFYGEGWMWDDEQEAFLPYLSAFPFMRNVISVTVSAADGRSPAVVDVDPSGGDIIVRRNVRVATRTQLRVGRVPRCNTVTVDGIIAPGDRHTFTVSMWKPENVLHAAFVDLLRKAGIADASLGNATAAEPADAVAVGAVIHRLSDILPVVNKESDNLAAECVLRALAAAETAGEASTHGALAVQKHILGREGVDTSGVALVDGSGISFYNLVSAAAVVRLLRAMAHRPEYASYKNSLAIGGKDGTLRGRFSGMPHAEAVHAKTGTIRGVSALSGYILPPGGRELAFSILMQNFVGSAHKYREAQDRIVRLCISYATATPSR